MTEGSLNTSHVLIYRNRVYGEYVGTERLNTSHVLIYLFLAPIFHLSKRFKYISCSYLSILAPTYCERSFSFKYISCSYLSSSLPAPVVFSTTFKYISCSYLSHVFKPFFNLIYPFFPLNSSISQNFTNRLSFFD